jgi:hypothetical protein
MSENADNLTEQTSAFQKIWMDSLTHLMQTAFASPPEAAPPELLRQMRSGIFQALAKSWDEYLRSPQFAEGMKQWMDSAIHYRKMTNDLLTRAHHETQDVARQDIDSLMLAVRHMETRILDRLEELSARIGHLEGSKANGPARPRAKTVAGAGAGAAPQKTARPRQARNPRPKTQSTKS